MDNIKTQKEKEAEVKLAEELKHIEAWKIKRMIKKLENSKGNGTSMISLSIPADKQISLTTKLLNEEYGAASQIKSSKTRSSVQTAITSTRERLKLYNRTPKNGLIVFCGIVLMEDGKTEKKINIDFEPFKPVTSSKYFCDDAFHPDLLMYLLDDDEKFGFIVVDGSGVLYATLQGNNREVLQRMSVELPKKHGRGGQSAVRFARQREEKRAAYLKKVAELTNGHFITDNMPNVKGLVLAGSASFKNMLQESDHFDKRLSELVVSVVDVSYGGDNGFNQAIQLASDAISNVKFVQEKKIVSKFFEHISMDTGMVVFGVEDTMKAFEEGNAERLMMFENLETMRYVVKNPVKGEEQILILSPQQEKDPKWFKDKETGIDLEIVDSEPLSDWLCINYQKQGAQLEILTDKSQEGFQFVKGFGGMGAFLRYQMQEVNYNHGGENSDDDFDPEEDFI